MTKVPPLEIPMTKFLPFALPDISEEEIQAVVECLRSGWVTTGPRTKQFEADFAAYFGDGVEAIALNSATAGLHLVLEALGIGAGDEVIVPTLTFTATAEVVRYLGADPVLADCDPVTLNIDVTKLENLISPKTKAIIPVHYGGLACDMDAILEIAQRHRLKVVEDAAHAFPATYKGKLVGALQTDATVFSFYANKPMTTGEGGMVVTRDPAIVNRIKVMRLHGISRDAFDRFISEKPAWFYEVVAPGYKYNMTDIAAAIGIQQLRRIDDFLQKRQHLARRYYEELQDLPLVLPKAAPEGDMHAWHLFVVRLTKDAAIERNELIQKLSEQGIGLSVHFIPLHRHSYWRDTYRLRAEQFPCAEEAYHSMFSLPLYTKMTDDDQSRVVAAVRKLLCA